MSYKDKFKKFGGSYIPDIIEYLKGYIEKEPGVTISVGCDSIQVRRKTIYAITIMLYSQDIKNGAHVVFFRESCSKIRDIQMRLYKEAEYLHEVGEFINSELDKFYKRSDLSDFEKKRYKYHILKSNGEYKNVELHQEESVIKNLILTESDNMEFKNIDLHVDFNPFEGDRGHRNKSNIAYKNYVPWLRGLGYRVWAKPSSAAASSAADLLLHG